MVEDCSLPRYPQDRYFATPPAVPKGFVRRYGRIVFLDLWVCKISIFDTDRQPTPHDMERTDTGRVI